MRLKYRPGKRIAFVVQNGDACQYHYDDGTHSDWVPAPGFTSPGMRFHPPADDRSDR